MIFSQDIKAYLKNILKDLLSSISIAIFFNNATNASRIWMACHSYENEFAINSERYLFLSRLRTSIFLPECTRRCTRASSFVARRRKTYPIFLPSPWQMPVDGLDATASWFVLEYSMAAPRRASVYLVAIS